jgi:hypothetical protein
VSAGVDRTSGRVTLGMLCREEVDDSGVGARRTVSVKTERAQDGRRWMVGYDGWKLQRPDVLGQRAPAGSGGCCQGKRVSVKQVSRSHDPRAIHLSVTFPALQRASFSQANPIQSNPHISRIMVSRFFSPPSSCPPLVALLHSHSRSAPAPVANLPVSPGYRSS